MTHTPGPWTHQFKSSMVYGERHWIFSEASKEAVAMVHLERTAKEATEEHIANARLIAAAPELLEALKDSRDLIITLWINIDEDSMEKRTLGKAFDIASQAIAKAEGFTPAEGRDDA